METFAEMKIHEEILQGFYDKYLDIPAYIEELKERDDVYSVFIDSHSFFIFFITEDVLVITTYILQKDGLRSFGLRFSRAKQFMENNPSIKSQMEQEKLLELVSDDQEENIPLGL